MFFLPDPSSGGSCAVAFPPEAAPLTFRTGSPQPTCAGTGCGTSWAGFFCAGYPLTQNPDFLDPRNPDSVQNPDSPYYEDWDGTITRTTTTTTTTSTRTSTTTAPTSTRTPDGSIGDNCYLKVDCDDDCPSDQILACRNGVCSCAADQNIPPYGTMSQSLQGCLNVYWCAPGDTMVCEPRDHSSGKGLCLCIAGSTD